jgi:hypothetical protein
MTSPDVFMRTEAYIAEQERTARFVPDDELAEFVPQSIGTLTIDCMQPIIHDVSATVPKTRYSHLRSELINRGVSALAMPLPSDALPAHHTMERGDYFTNALLLQADASLIKILASWAPDLPETTHSMKVVNFTLASEQEAHQYKSLRPHLSLADDTPILMPRKEVGFDATPWQNNISCRYHQWGEGGADISYNPNLGHLPEPADGRTLHSAFMLESRYALLGLKSLLI